MKLWKKIAVISCAVLVLLFSGIFLTVTQQVKMNYLTHTREQAWQDHGELLVTFLRQVQKAHAGSESPIEAKVKYVFSQCGDETAVLVREGKVLSSHISFDPQQLLAAPDDGSTRSLETELDKVPYLIFASQLVPFGSENPGYCVYTVIDLSPVYEEIHQMALTTAGRIGGTMLLGMILIVALIHHTMKPLEKLNDAAGRIAEGNYAERIGICRKDEIGELAQSFDRMADSVEATVSTLQEQNRRQKLFIGAVSHEFKTPLTSLLLNADSLQNTYMTEEEQLDTVANMEKQCKWLEKMTGSLLKLLSVEKALDIQPVSLPSLMQALRESCEDTLKQFKINLEIACDDTVFLLDKDLMQCALLNLIHNAARASQPGQSIAVYVHGTTFEIIDHGKGIPKEDLPRITEPFYMVDKSRSKNQGGTGLGLALVNEIVKAHGGTLEIESTVNSGTTVSFTLPEMTEEKRV